jgi:hypothetical protein
MRAGPTDLRNILKDWFCLEHYLQRELCRAWAPDRVQRALSGSAASAACFKVRCRPRTDLAEGRIRSFSIAGPDGIRVALRSGQSEHRVVEEIEILDAHIEFDALGQVKATPQSNIGLVDCVRAAQPFLGRFPFSSSGRAVKAAGFNALPLGCVESAIQKG